jgi:hypothetical protein
MIANFILLIHLIEIFISKTEKIINAGLYIIYCIVMVYWNGGKTTKRRLGSPVFSKIFQYLQYWYYQYFPESSSICNTGITSIFQNLPVLLLGLNTKQERNYETITLSSCIYLL